MTTQKSRDEKRAEKYSYRFRNKYYYTAHLSGIRAERRRVVAAIKQRQGVNGCAADQQIFEGCIKTIKGDGK